MFTSRLLPRALLPGLFLLTSLAFAGGGYLLFERQLADVRARRHAELAAIGQLKAAQIAEWRKERLAEARFHAREPDLSVRVAQWLERPGAGNLKARIAAQLKLAREDGPGYRDALLARPDGELLLSLDDRLTELDTAARELVSAAASSGNARLGEIHLDPESGQLHLDVAAPMFDGAGRPMAVLLLQSAPEDSLYPLVQSWPTPSETAETLLVRRDGDDIVFLNRLRHTDAPPLSIRRPVSDTNVVGVRAATGQRGIVERKDYRGVDVLADVQPIPGSNWFMVVKVDAAEILAEARYRGTVIAGIVGIGVAIAAILFVAVFSLQRQKGYQALFRAERARRAALEEYRAALRGIGDAVISTDATGAVRHMNPVAESLTGWREENARGQPLRDVFRIVNEYTGAEVESPVARVLREGIVVGLANHTLLIARDGTERPIADSGAPIRSEDGATIGVVLVFRDQTAERAAQAALAASERRFRATFEQAAVGLAHLAPDGRWIDVNQRLCDIVGYTRDELLSRTWQDLTHADDVAHNADGVRRMLDGEITAYAPEKRYVRRNGDAIWTQVTAAPVRKTDGSIDYIVAVVEDISERKRAEEELRKLSRAVEQSSESIVIANARAEIEYVNRAFERASGYRLEEVLGRNPRILKSGKTPSKTYESMWSTLLRGEPWEGEFHNRRKDGSEYVESAVISPIRQADGAVTHYLAVKADVTQRRRIEQELDRYRHHLEELVAERTTQLEEARRQADAANQAKSAFLANMSHEIRTPMNGVLGMLEVLERTRLTEQQTELVRTAQESGRTLLGIIDDILDFSKIEAGRLEIEAVPMSVADVVEALCDSLAPIALRANVDLGVFVAPEIPERVVADPLRLRQVLFNLLGNAIKFAGGRTEVRGRVWLRVTVAGDAPLKLAFAVIDNGIGMSVETVARLFTPFTQGEVSTTRRYGGTGLGLTICKRLAGLMHGEVAVDSRLGSGSTFTLTLPVEVPSEQPVRALPDLRGLDCLVVETQDMDIDGMCRYLESAGARVRRIADAASVASLALDPQAPAVLIRHAGYAQPLQVSFPAQKSNLRQVLITHGRRRRARVESQEVVTLDGMALRRHALLRAVAVAAGRASPEFVPEVSPQPQVPASSAADARARGELILVAEDDAVNQEVILHQLELLGYAADLAKDGTEALERLRHGRYALLLTDLHMPVMDGYALTLAIRRHEAERAPVRRLPIIALTANALRGEAERAKSLGVDDFLTKPLKLDSLRAALARRLSARPATAPSDPLDRASGAGDALPALDLHVLRQIVGRDLTAARDLLAHYKTAASGQIEELRNSALATNLAQVASVAHKLKSSSRSVGALAFGELCARIEAASREGRSDVIAALIRDADDAFGMATAAIDAWLQRPAHGAASDPS